MKKLIPTFLTLFVAMSVSAVSVSWSANGSSARMTGLTSGAAMSTGENSETAGLKVYYILYSDYADVKNLGAVAASEIEGFAAATANGQTSSSSGAAGRVSGSSTITDYDTAGVSFFARAYTKFNGEDFFMDVFAGNGDGGVWTTTQNGDSTIVEKLAWANGTYGGSVSDAVGTKNAWVKVASVPEPATGALALAGIALLFRRRKA